MTAHSALFLGKGRRLLATGALVGAATMLTAADAPTGGEPGVRAFVLGNIYLANGGTGDICRAEDEGALERFRKLLPAAQQQKYADPAKNQELEKLMNEHFGFRRLILRDDRTGKVKLPPGVDRTAAITPEQALAIGALNGFPKGKGRPAFSKRDVVYSACSDPYDFPVLAKNFRTYDGPVAAGMNLDGKVSKEDFTGPDGEKGIDNQLWRVAGCSWPFREGSNPDIARKTLISSLAPTLIELRGVDDASNDPDVTVTVFAATTALNKDGKGGVLARATFIADPDPRLKATTHGRIENGVLTTDSFDMVLNYKEQIIDAPRHIRGARIRATLTKDGGIEGGFYGYYTLDSYYSSIEQMTQNGANLSRLTCPGIRLAIDRLADGYRDPKTGKYTAISSAYHFFGVRAFVVPPQQTARAE
ncbi:hypothetical protein [Sphingobium sp. EP60837]|nr:hypothetical protein [Sphingobium sp. EP60837]ANI79951.1 hypothetical protein EP837_03567 [Sphingobium sp. EP60837]